MKIVGLGPGGRSGLSVSILEAMRSSDQVILRTSHHPTAVVLQEEGIPYSSFDELYDKAASLEDVYQGIVRDLLERERQGERVLYAVPGHPMVAERSVELLLQRAPEAGVVVEILPSPSFIEACLVALGLPLGAGLQVIDAQSMPECMPHPNLPSLIYQVDDAMVASEVKLALQTLYPDEAEVAVVRAAGTPEQQTIERLPLYRLDRTDFNHLTTVYVPAVPASERRPIWEDLVEVVRRLRAPGGCPWDREQTHKSIRKYLLEEAYEALEAIDQEDPERLCDELGDLLLQATLHSQMASEVGDFDIRDVIEGITLKLIRRHPHVFGEVEVAGSEEVLRNWEQIKASEKVGQERKSVLDGIPRELPALMKAWEVSSRVVKVGFEWERLEDLWAKLHEELEELKEAVAAGNTEKIQSEVGDLIFTIVNVARWMKVDPEEALRLMVDRFNVRFRYIELKLTEQDRSLQDASLAEMEALWNEAKERLP
jgi:tetrapyrrole methylase family protein / MazG family protein